jgi:two-component system, NtrC family, sensor histidine kinase HydH
VTVDPIPQDTLTVLAALHTGSGGRPTVDRAAFLDASAALFESLGWAAQLWAVQGSAVELERVLGARGDAVGAVQEAVPLAELPQVERCVRTGRGDVSVSTAGAEKAVAVPVVVGDRVSHVVVVAAPSFTERDVAAVQLFAAQLAASEAYRQVGEDMARQQRLAALGQLSTVVAHEVRNPLAVIFQACRQLRREVGEQETATQLLHILDEEAERLRCLVDDLVDFAGPLQSRPQVVDLSELVGWCRWGMDEDGEADGRPKLTVRIDDDASLVKADPLLLRQALIHLLNHAAERAGASGHVELLCGRESSSVRIRVCDDGPPLPEEVAVNVFEPFFTTKRAGSGLGLAVVRRLVEHQGGRVVLDPANDDGCVISVYVPCVEASLGE